MRSTCVRTATVAVALVLLAAATSFVKSAEPPDRIDGAATPQIRLPSLDRDDTSTVAASARRAAEQRPSVGGTYSPPAEPAVQTNKHVPSTKTSYGAHNTGAPSPTRGVPNVGDVLEHAPQQLVLEQAPRSLSPPPPQKICLLYTSPSPRDS